MTSKLKSTLKRIKDYFTGADTIILFQDTFSLRIKLSKKFLIVLFMIVVTDCIAFKLVKNTFLGDTIKSNQEIKEINPDNVLPASEKRQIIVDRAKSLLGTPYKSGGTTPDGFDCSGFAQYVFKTANIKLPNGSMNQATLGDFVPLEKARPGDLLFFGKGTKRNFHTNHVGVVYENNKGKISIIHATSVGIVVDTQGSHSWKGYWKDRVLFAKQVID